MTAFEHKFVRLEDTETSEGFEQDGDRQVQRDWEAIRAWEQERTELLHRIRQSMAVHLEIENRQQQILQRAKCYQQLMVQSPEHGEQWLLHLHELNHEFKQADLMIEHEAMKLHFLQRHYNTIAMLLVDFVEQSNVAAQAFAAPLDRPWDTQEAVQDSPSKASWLNEPPLPDYVEPRRLRSRPYPFLVRTGLQMSQLCWGRSPSVCWFTGCWRRRPEAVNLG
ncbi:MAG: hypothetical protein HC771_18590 [Synechococcales cyanobacterium CRU_2_2]|nr:hypothetical protein [Synechococcales cyanobacterium CRU_2_2]